MNSKPKLNTYTSTDKTKLKNFNNLLKTHLNNSNTSLKPPSFSKLDLFNIKNYLTDKKFELNNLTQKIDEDTKRFNKFIRKRQRGTDDNLSETDSSEDEVDNILQGDDDEELELNKDSLLGEGGDNDEFKPNFEDKKSKRLRTTTTTSSINNNSIKNDDDLLKPPIAIVKEESPERELRSSSRLRSRSSRNTPLLEPELLPPSVKEKVKASPRRNNKSKPSKILSNRNTPNSEISNTEGMDTPRSPLPPKAPKISLEAIKTKIQEAIQLRPPLLKPEGVKCESKIADSLLEIEEDFTKQNNTNQTPITTFYNWLDPYLRNITEDDLKVLQTDSDIEPYLVIPPPGKNYKERWNEKDRKLSVSSKDSGTINAPDQPSTSLAGPFSTRLFAALLQEQIDIPPPPEDDTEDEGADQAQTQTGQNSESLYDNEFEKRVRRELLFLGLIQEEDLENPAQTDESPVLAELKRLQNQLREQSRINKARKQKLLQIAQEHIAYQEYTAILDELDKTVEQSYIKRLKSLKAKKKKSTALRPLSDSTLAALDRRQRFLSALSPLFNKESYDLPKESIYKDIVNGNNNNTD